MEQLLKVIRRVKAKFIVIYFYPKDNTTGCTTEATEFNTLINEFKNQKTLIIGVSRDSEVSHQKFSEKLDLNFPLISDKDKKLHRKFRVLKEQNEKTKVIRSTFIFKPKQLIEFLNSASTCPQDFAVVVFKEVKPQGHANTVLSVVQSLG